MSMSRAERTGTLLFLALLVYPLYWPLSHVGLERAHAPVLAADRATPLVPGWTWAYAMVYLTAILPICVVRHSALFRGMARAYLGVMITSFNLFWLVPVRMTLRPPALPVDGFTSWGLRLIYHYDPPSNCFPSMHVALAVLAALCCWRVDRLWGGLAAIGALAISASTMLVKQHYLVDVLAGVALALVSYRLFVAGKIASSPQELRYPRWLALALVTFYFSLVGGLYLVYRTGWAPWAA